MPRIGIREAIAVNRVLARGQLLRYRGGENGFTDRFEANFATKMGVKHALAVNSGTSALIASLVGVGIGPGDEVLVPAYTWVATAAAVLAVGAVPILVDIDETLTMDPADLEKKINPHTKAVIPVHMSNLVCDMDAIMEIARRHKLIVVEDACQAVGIYYKDKRVGSIGNAGAFSFNQYKNLNSGEGGAIVTCEDKVFTRARMYHDVGSYTREHEFPSNEAAFAGVNFRISEITGAILHAQLPKLDPLVRRLCRRRKLMASVLAKAKRFRISPHNDPTSAAGLTIVFDSAREAESFAKQNIGVERPIDTGRHVYTNWIPILTRRTFDERMNPFNWASRQIEYSVDTCARSLDIMSRTCRVSLAAQYPSICSYALSRHLIRGSC